MPWLLRSAYQLIPGVLDGTMVSIVVVVATVDLDLMPLGQREVVTGAAQRDR